MGISSVWVSHRWQQYRYLIDMLSVPHQYRYLIGISSAPYQYRYLIGISTVPHQYRYLIGGSGIIILRLSFSLALAELYLSFS